MIVEINSLEDLSKYYLKNLNTYRFPNTRLHPLCDVVFNIDIEIKSNIHARNIKAKKITALHVFSEKSIHAQEIQAHSMLSYGSITAKIINVNNTIKTLKNINISSIHASNIFAGGNIFAKNITVNHTLSVNDIIANKISAKDIQFYSICIARNQLTYSTIKSTRKNGSFFHCVG